MKKHFSLRALVIFLSAAFPLWMLCGCDWQEAKKDLSISFPASQTVVREPFFTARGDVGENDNVQVWVEKDGQFVCDGQNVSVSNGTWSADFNLLLNPYGDYKVRVKGLEDETTIAAEIETDFDSQVIVLTGTDIDAGAMYRELTGQEIIILRGRQPEKYFYGSDFSLIPADPFNLALPEGLPEDYYMPYSDLSFRIHGAQVEEITVLTNAYSLVNGLTVGSSFAEVKNIFGEGYELKEIPGCNRYFVSYPSLGVMFEILYADDTVSELNVLQVVY